MVQNKIGVEIMEFKIGDRLVHKKLGIRGYFLKAYYPTCSARTLQIRCDDGRVFYAPYTDFIKIN